MGVPIEYQHPLGSGRQALKLVLELAELAHYLWGWKMSGIVGTLLQWAHNCQRYGLLDDAAMKDRKWRRLSNAKMRERRRKLGLCYACGKKASPGRAYCSECTEKRRGWLYGRGAQIRGLPPGNGGHRS